MSHWFCMIDPTTDETKRHFIVITAGDQAFRKNCSLLFNLNRQNLGQIITKSKRIEFQWSVNGKIRRLYFYTLEMDSKGTKRLM